MDMGSGRKCQGTWRAYKTHPSPPMYTIHQPTNTLAATPPPDPTLMMTEWGEWQK